jgi:hypothetical protein
MTGAGPSTADQRTSVTRRVEELRRALPGDIHLSYAGSPRTSRTLAELL